MPASEHLLGRWTHAHEEDTGEERVYRPATHRLPPARGRTSFELRADGTFAGAAPGPADRPQAMSGRWTLAGDDLTLIPGGDGPAQTLRITAVTADRLAVRVRR